MSDSDTIDTKQHCTGGGAEAGLHGCEHYRRRCKLVAPCCGGASGAAFWCRHCHNDAPAVAGSHALDRRAVREVVCALCATRQPVSRECARCGSAFGAYSCLECNFFDDDASKGQFHCDECGICRVGGRDNFFHCRTCNSCYATAIRDSHRCVEDSMRHDCPICREFLFDTLRPVSVLPCGHTIHCTCLAQLLEHGAFACPVCSKTCVDGAAWSRYCRQLDDAIAQTPMPDPGDTGCAAVRALCNDCGGRFEAAFHVLGHKCPGCSGYNTRRIA